MALVNCSECGGEVSDKAAACMRCGAPVAALTRKPTEAQSRPAESSFKWWFWIPLGLGAAFLIFGALIPKNVADANAAYRLCRDLYSKGQVGSMRDCETLEAQIRNKGQGNSAANSPGPAVDAAAIDAALADGRKKVNDPKKPVEWPKPPANLFEGQPPLK